MFLIINVEKDDTFWILSGLIWTLQFLHQDINYRRKWKPEGWMSCYHKQDENRRHPDSRDRQKFSDKSSKQQEITWKSCRKLSCIISGGWGSDRDTQTDGDADDANPGHVDSPRLLFSLMLFSCSCSNRTVSNNNNNNKSREKCWLTGSPSTGRRHDLTCTRGAMLLKWLA